MLPICSFCKRIRDNGSNWVQMEQYISSHSEAESAMASVLTAPKVFRGFEPKKINARTLNFARKIPGGERVFPLRFVP